MVQNERVMLGSPRPSIAILESRWAHRLRSELFACGGVVAFHAPSECGAEYVISGVGSKDRPLIWIEFDDRDQDDEMSQGARAFEVCERVLGFRLPGARQPLRHVIRQLAISHALLGPFTLCLSGLASPRLPLGELFELAQLGSSVWLHFSCPESWGEVVIGGVQALDTEQFFVHPDEVSELLAGFSYTLRPQVLSPEAGAPRALLSLLREAIRADELAMVLRPTPGGATLLDSGESDLGDPDRVAELLLSRGRPIEAYELLIRTQRAPSETLANAAGREYSERGLFRRLWRVLDAAAPMVRWSSDASMRWYFAAAAAENQHVRVKDEVSRYLAQRDAPELRALFAAAFPGPEFYEEAARAAASAETSTTLRVMAFAEILQGSSQAAAVLLQRALRMSERIGDSAMVVASATDLSDLSSREGKYRDAVSWADWAVDWYQRTGCRDELRLAVARALGSFNTILVSDDVSDVLFDVDVDLSRAGIPTSEALLSTAAETAFVRGDLVHAERLLRVALDRSHLQQIPGVCVDLVHVLRGVGNHKEAQRVAMQAHTISKQSSGVPRALGLLAMGMALIDSNANEAESHLARALDQLHRAHEAPRLAQCAVYLAMARMLGGNPMGAQQALKRGERGLRELGLSGWILLGGHTQEVSDVRNLFSEQLQDLQLEFLGGRTVRVNSEAEELGLRQCEVLVALATCNGLSADQLGLHVYGDSANVPTVKAIVSRLRQSVGVHSKPYRLKHGVSADFLELEGLIAAGRLREAVVLYRGQLLPGSEAPIVVELREHLEELMRRAVVSAGDVELLVTLSDALGGDPELLDVALASLNPLDARVSVVRAKRAKVDRDWRRDN